MTSLNNSKLIQLNFGTNILTTPTVENSYSFSTVSRPYRVKLVQQANKYFAVVSNETLSIAIIDFNDLDPLNAPVSIAHSGLPTLLAIESFRYKGVGLVTGVGTSDNILRKVIFEADCGASIDFSSSKKP
ncbi:MAG TPA: hypothetical protein PKN99_03480, partial [Cyclobacteriaceae bacterium]|nr:hypothetical protein [Cyclobacteriaceae bacterium]